MKNKITGNNCSCCSFNFPEIPTQWLLFFDFAFTFGTTIVYFADIVTDIITLEWYFKKEWYYAFGLSVFFIVAPSILVAILEYTFLKKYYGKQVPWKTIALRTVLNVPFQLTVIWYHCQLSYSYMKNWLDYIRGNEIKNTPSKWYQPTTLERSRGASLSSLNELDFLANSPTREAVEASEAVGITDSRDAAQGMGSITNMDGSGEEKTTWWKKLTKELWHSHLNKLKLCESLLESLPQLLINLYLIIRYSNTAGIQYVSAILSYISLCGGVVRYDKTKKDNEADRWMVDKTLRHSRVFYTKLEWPQLLFISIYKGSFLAARSLAFVYFSIYFGWAILIPLVIHWAGLLSYLIYRWYPDFTKVTKQLRQADYKYRAYVFLSRDFMSVLLESLIGIVIHVRPYFHAFLDQPYCFMFWYYVAYVSENITLFLIPGIIKASRHYSYQLELYRYYPLLATQLLLNVAGATFCAVYYLAVHKSRAYTAHAYPAAAKALCCCCFPDPVPDDLDFWLPLRHEWTVCKQVETSELFFLTKEQLETFHQTYNTAIRNDRRRGRAIECFVDDRCRIFYAPRHKMKKLHLSEVDDAHMRPSYKKLKDAHERTTTANGENSEVGDTDSKKNELETMTNRNDAHTNVDIHASANEKPQVNSTPEPLERPVRKPRVKSLRSSQSRDESTRQPLPVLVSGAPVPLPRKSPKATQIFPLFLEEESQPVPESPKSTLSYRQSSPQRTDDVDMTSSKPLAEFDDSTYRVSRPSRSGKQQKRKGSDAAREGDDQTAAGAGEELPTYSGWKQTWI